MKLRSTQGPVDRDWFGLECFLPGPRFTSGDGCLYLLDEVGSTNAFLRGRGPAAEGRVCRWDGWGWVAAERRELAPPTAPVAGSVAVARRQTAGQGRQGRVWRDCGGLHLSVVVAPQRAAIEQGFSVWLGLITVLVLREEYRLDARLKWPNDIMIAGRKLGGILLERAATGERSQVVAGLGLNLTTGPGGFPAELQGTATSVQLAGGGVLRPGEVAARIIGRVEQELTRFQNQGWQPFRPALALLDCLLGLPVRLTTRERQIIGRAVGIDDRGRLLVEVPVGDGGRQVETFPAGEVHILATTAAATPDDEEKPCAP